MRVEPLYVTWLNYLGGFEYFFFKSEKEYQVEITGSGVTRQNTFTQWPKSWGEYADTIDKSTHTIAKNKIIVISQHLTENQRDSLKFIKISPVVQIVYSRTNRRTMLVDKDSFKVYSESENLFTIQFTMTNTDELTSQRL